MPDWRLSLKKANGTAVLVNNKSLAFHYFHLNRNLFVMHRTHISKNECGFCPYSLQHERRGSIHRKYRRGFSAELHDELNLLLIRKISSRILEISFLCYYNYYLYYIYIFQKVMEVWISNEHFWPYTMPPW